jgi:hypothetical protein
VKPFFRPVRDKLTVECLNGHDDVRVLFVVAPRFCLPLYDSLQAATRLSHLFSSSLVRDVTNFLEKLATWPRGIGYAIRDARETFPSPLDEYE